MNLKDFLDKQEKQKNGLVFYSSFDRELVFNFSAYKLTLVEPIAKVRRVALPGECLSTDAQRRWHDFDKYLENVREIYIASKSDFDLLQNEITIEYDKWIYTGNSLHLTISNPIYHKKLVIQDAKCWLTSDSGHLGNYINSIDFGLIYSYFDKN